MYNCLMGERLNNGMAGRIQLLFRKKIIFLEDSIFGVTHKGYSLMTT